ncbi:hypothetical protein Dsin_002857 [Dipteronia sinensis]|uniref:Reverse transcriptase domain-containing protein n=1 Tax=Dipteronia sinensis TaxID=43782 RepID=A0AAE0EJT5_9ROSI|nr:hypothetical protein Dsin_002857 [Dipteronia sinensis]
MANRLRAVLGKVISETQRAFILGRLISDNAIIGFECMHALRIRRCKDGSMAVKLDMSKAYDRVEWGFLVEVLLKMGFPGDLLCGRACAGVGSCLRRELGGMLELDP